MDRKKISILLFIASLGLAVAGIIFLLMAMFGEDKRNWVIASALFCVLLSNLFQLVRFYLNKKSSS